MEVYILGFFKAILVLGFFSALGYAIFLFYRDVVAIIVAYFRPLKHSYQAILEKYFLFYMNLPEKQKKLFRKKLQRFLFSKQFIPRQIPEVTDEMRVLIGASAVQLTLGLDQYILSHFQKILVYPDNYYSNINRRYHKGEVNPRFGIIVLSWRNFLEGYANPTNALNLGLHEMAHALKIENKLRDYGDKILSNRAYKKWNDLVMEELILVKEGKECLFREYGCVNEHEFFSVAVENFFERPDDFRTRNSQLYHTLCQLLNQDPLMGSRPPAR
jgi:MtfA peptidase